MSYELRIVVRCSHCARYEVVYERSITTNLAPYFDHALKANLFGDGTPERAGLPGLDGMGATDRKTWEVLECALAVPLLAPSAAGSRELKDLLRECKRTAGKPYSAAAKIEVTW